MLRVSFICLLSLVVASAASTEEPRIADDKVVSVVEERMDDWWLKSQERRFDLIGWAEDVRAARKLSAESGRPLFLFTMDGRVNTGRC